MTAGKENVAIKHDNWTVVTYLLKEQAQHGKEKIHTALYEDECPRENNKFVCEIKIHK